ncbi:hypothetical protein N7475_002060 [Penicillium sp. IBT 31633x]|nr:hypothetical protein N7475_002060 [Penicillium sp. IBT 31633x]
MYSVMLYSLHSLPFLLLTQSFTLAAAVQNPSFARFPTVGNVPRPPTTFHASLSADCPSDLNDLKAQYNTIFDGDYGSKFDDEILTLCYNLNNEAHWKKNQGFGPSYRDKFDKVVNNCCAASM